MSDIAEHNLDFLPPGAAALAKAAARPRATAMICVAALAGLGWFYLGLRYSSDTDIFAALCRPLGNSAVASAQDAALVLAMWGAMVLAMMLPSAAPMILTYAEIAGTAARKRIAVVSPVALTAGYAAVWLGFALGAAAAQVVLDRAGVLEPTTGSIVSWLSSALFIGAGLYQFSTLKQACLRQCRSPFPFFFTNWTTTRGGVFRLGLKQGLFCLGCCWAAMLLMLSLGVMNLIWMAVLAVAMTIEKLVNSTRLSYAFGLILIAIGLSLMPGVGI
jgi:predicted metal-binding membrane protein